MEIPGEDFASSGTLLASYVHVLGQVKETRAVELLLPLLSNNELQEAVVQALGNIGDARAVEPLIGLLLAPERKVSDWRLKEALGNLGEPAVDPLIEIALNHADSSIRTSAMETLGKTGSERMIETLLSRLDNSDPQVWVAVIGAFENLGEAGVKATMPLLNSGNVWLRRGGAGAFLTLMSNADDPLKGRLGTALIPLLNDSDAATRAIASSALGESGLKEFAPLLIPLLEAEDAVVRWVTADSIEKIPDARAVPGLIKLLADTRRYEVPWMIDDQGEVVCRAAVDALVKIGEPAVEALLPVLSHADAGVRARAAEALGKIEDVRAIPGLIALLRDDSTYIDPEKPENEPKAVYEAASEALRRIGPEDALPSLAEQLQHPDARVRLRVVRTIIQFSEHTVRIVVEQAAKDSDPLVRGAAEEKLRKWDTPLTLRDPFEEFASDDDADDIFTFDDQDTD